MEVLRPTAMVRGWHPGQRGRGGGGGGPAPERVILSAKEVVPRPPDNSTINPALLPAILINAGGKDDQFFFFSSRGNRGDYLGLWAGAVRYHEWIHLAVTLESDVMKVFVNGVYQDYLRAFPPSPTYVCPYDSGMKLSAAYASSSSSSSTSSSRKGRRGTSSSSSSTTSSGGGSGRRSHRTHIGGSRTTNSKTKVGAKYRSASSSPMPSVLRNHWAAHANNTVLHVMSYKNDHHRTVTGMVGNLVVIRNYAMDNRQIGKLMEKTCPPHMPTFSHLLELYEIPSLEGICPMLWEFDFNTSVNLGICPQIVCGDVTANDLIFYHPRWIHNHNIVAAAASFRRYGPAANSYDAISVGGKNLHNKGIGKESIPSFPPSGRQFARNGRLVMVPTVPSTTAINAEASGYIASILGLKRKEGVGRSSSSSSSSSYLSNDDSSSSSRSFYARLTTLVMPPTDEDSSDSMHNKRSSPVSANSVGNLGHLPDIGQPTAAGGGSGGNNAWHDGDYLEIPASEEELLSHILFGPFAVLISSPLQWVLFLVEGVLDFVLDSIILVLGGDLEDSSSTVQFNGKSIVDGDNDGSGNRGVGARSEKIRDDAAKPTDTQAVNEQNSKKDNTVVTDPNLKPAGSTRKKPSSDVDAEVRELLSKFYNEATGTYGSWGEVVHGPESVGRKAQLSYAEKAKVRAQGLYKAAMIWLNGRYAVGKEAGEVEGGWNRMLDLGRIESALAIAAAPSEGQVGGKSHSTPGQMQQIQHELSLGNFHHEQQQQQHHKPRRTRQGRSHLHQSVRDFRETAHERAYSALMLAMLMGDSARTADDDDISWSFRTASLLNQPIQMALGFRAGYDAAAAEVVHNDDVDAILNQPHGSALRNVLGGASLQDLVFFAARNGNDADDADDAGNDSGAAVVGARYKHGEGGAVDLRNIGKNRRYVGHGKDDDGGNIDERLGISRVHTERRGGTAEVAVDVSGDIHASPPSRRVSHSTSTSQARKDWLRLLSNISIDSTITELDSPLGSLRPLMTHGMTIHAARDMLIRRRLRLQQLPPASRAQERQAAMNQLVRERVSAAARTAVEEWLGTEAGEISQQGSRAPSTATRGSGALNHGSSVFHQNECLAAAAYYFPVTQYVSSRMGKIESGVGILEEVRLVVSGSNPVGHGGEEDELHVHNEAQAHDGDAHAQTYLGKKYFWGWGGVQRNERVARRWFEQAAEQGDPEGLYNMGAFYANGQAGLPRDAAMALDYFEQAANAPEHPFPMAMHALGNHYLYSAKPRNYTLAREWFLKAAKRHNGEDAHFALAMMLREGKGGPVNIPLCVAHLAHAASWGHVRALNFLAHGLYDSESWLHQYGREQHLLERNAAMRSMLVPPSTTFSSPRLERGTSISSTNTNTNTRAFVFSGRRDSTSTADSDDAHNSTEVDVEKASRDLLDFNEDTPITIYLPSGEIVELPYPVGSSTGSCEAALPLLKHLAEMSYRTKDTTSKALQLYMKGDVWAALDLFEEAADLGVRAAQENAAHIYEQLIPTECAQYGDYYYDLSNQNAGTDMQVESLQEGSELEVAIDGRAETETPSSMAVSSTSSSSSLSPFSSSSSSSFNISGEEYCKQFLQKLSGRRWSQLAHAGEPRAMRRVADLLKTPTTEHLLLGPPQQRQRQRQLTIASPGTPQASLLAPLVAPTSDETFDASFTSSHESNPDNTPAQDDATAATEWALPMTSARQSDRAAVNRQAALMYAMAGELGDAESLLQLGWMLYYGEEGKRLQLLIQTLNCTLLIETFSCTLLIEKLCICRSEP